RCRRPDQPVRQLPRIRLFTANRSTLGEDHVLRKSISQRGAGNRLPFFSMCLCPSLSSGYVSKVSRVFLTFVQSKPYRNLYKQSNIPEHFHKQIPHFAIND